ncbi:oxidoreductase [Paraburkholderia sp. MMS20-SJTN17]|uniref:Oxidoreductase n=1 Tax=Paraburkholderia translucens TaxID=2886945 RepID=A0ABS8KJR0_9BURK|nr:oxidoreductase [Paraburkholderia sp. MMS20-SJTN17]MCC8404639.1 oxidoreductase [Paraburkholderia sp. MMS20-SJTN17]
MRNGNRLYLITGASGGLGRAFAEAALCAGERVVGTVRSETDRVRFESLHATAAKAVILDVRNFDSIESVVRQIEDDLGPIDVLVNNAGYGHEGVLEESPLDELIRQFEVNVFGAVAMIKAVLPGMRSRRSGHIINITSMAGHTGLPGIAYYCGSKFALEGISDSLSKEVRALGIRVTAVAPGSFRTEWAGRSMVRSERSIADYDPIFDPVRQRRQEYSGHQAGDPTKAAQAILRIVDAPEPPTHLLLGSDARRLVEEHRKTLEREFEKWQSVTRSTSFEQQPQATEPTLTADCNCRERASN